MTLSSSPISASISCWILTGFPAVGSNKERTTAAARRACGEGRGAADQCAQVWTSYLKLQSMALFSCLQTYFSWPKVSSERIRPAWRLLSAGLTQEGQREEELRAVLEHVKATAAPLPQRLAELRDIVEREAQELRRREAGMPEL